MCFGSRQAQEAPAAVRRAGKGHAGKERSDKHSSRRSGGPDGWRVGLPEVGWACRRAVERRVGLLVGE